MTRATATVWAMDDQYLTGLRCGDRRVACELLSRKIQLRHLLFDGIGREIDPIGTQFVDSALQRLDTAWLGRDIGHADPPLQPVHTRLSVRHRETSYPHAPVRHC